jgi:hypothetical protein
MDADASANVDAFLPYAAMLGCPFRHANGWAIADSAWKDGT